MISKKSIYGLQASILLAKHYDKGPVLITDLALEGHIPKKFLEAILLDLRKAGYLNSKKGKGGGYVLAKSPQNISLGDIIKTLDGSFLDFFFENQTKETGEIIIIFTDLQDAIKTILNKITLADVLERASSNQNVMNYMI